MMSIKKPNFLDLADSVVGGNAYLQPTVFSVATLLSNMYDAGFHAGKEEGWVGEWEKVEIIPNTVGHGFKGNIQDSHEEWLNYGGSDNDD